MVVDVGVGHGCQEGLANRGESDLDSGDDGGVAEIGSAVEVIEGVVAIELEVADNADLVDAGVKGGGDGHSCGAVGGTRTANGSSVVGAS